MNLGLDPTQVPFVADARDWCWYPSAGGDLEDIVQYHSDTLRRHGVKVAAPEFFVHTDYWREALDRLELKAARGSPVFKDDRTEMHLQSLSELRVAAGVRFYVDPGFVDIPDLAFPSAHAKHLRLRISSTTLGTFERDVLYFYFENINFLEEVVLRGSEHVSHIFKKNEGCGFGFNRRSISFVYALLGALETKTIFVDSEVHYDHDTFVRSRDLLARALRGARSGIRLSITDSPEPSGLTLYRVLRTGRLMSAAQIAKLYSLVKSRGR